MNKAELIVHGILLELHYVVNEKTFNRLVEFVGNQLNAQQSVHQTALRRWSGASFLLNIVLLIVLAFIIGGR